MWEDSWVEYYREVRYKKADWIQCSIQDCLFLKIAKKKSCFTAVYISYRLYNWSTENVSGVSRKGYREVLQKSVSVAFHTQTTDPDVSISTLICVF